MPDPFVSIIIPAYNAQDYIRATLESVAAQTYPDFEVIIVDDSSTDSTGEIAMSFADDPRFKVIRRQVNGGVAAAENDGVLSARGKWIGLLGADDLWMPDKLSKQVELARTHDDTALIFGNGIEFNDGGDIGPFYRERRKFPEGDVYLRVLGRNCFWASSVMVKRQDILDAGLFRTDLRAASDHDMWIKILRRGGMVRGVWEPIVRYRIHAASVSRDRSVVYGCVVAMYTDALSKARSFEETAVIRKALAKAKADLLLAQAHKELRTGGSLRTISSMLISAWVTVPGKPRPLGWTALSMLGMRARLIKCLSRRW